MSTEPEHQSLAGQTIAIAESRESDLFAQLLRAEGANVVLCPMISIIDAPDQDAVRTWLARLYSHEFQDLIFMTGEGFRRLAKAAADDGAIDRFKQALARARKITRGPKPARALKELGFSVDLAAPAPTTPGIITGLSPLDLKGHKVGVQLFGDQPNEPLIEFLRSKGAEPDPVIAYVYAPKADDQRCLDLMEQLARGEIDILAFTSASQIERLVAVAAEHQKTDLLKGGLAKTRIAALGPVVADELAKHDIRIDIPPAAPFVLKNFIRTIRTHVATDE